MGIRGHVIAELFDPNGNLKQRVENHNLVTDKGDAYFAQLAYGSAWATHALKLGTANTTPSKTYNNAGAYIASGDYVNGSAHICDNGSPKQGASANILHFEHTWTGAEANANIQRVSLVNNATNAAEADGTNTAAIALLSPAVNKASGDTLKITWLITFTGS